EPEPDQPPGGAQHGRAADDDAGQGDEDHRELAGARVDDVVLEGFQDPGQRAEAGAHHEVADLDLVAPDTGSPRASRLPPTEIVYRPHLVRVRITWKIRTRTLAQMISDQASTPNQRPSPSDSDGILHS